MKLNADEILHSQGNYCGYAGTTRSVYSHLVAYKLLSCHLLYKAKVTQGAVSQLHEEN